MRTSLGKRGEIAENQNLKTQRTRRTAAEDAEEYSGMLVENYLRRFCLPIWTLRTFDYVGAFDYVWLMPPFA